MSRTPSPPRRYRSALAACVIALALAGCSSDGAGGGDASPEDAATKRVAAAGISFEVPASWKEVDPEERAEDMGGDMGEDSALSEYADQLGIAPDQLEQALGGLDLVLVSGEDEPPGNLNVVRVAGRMPTDRLAERDISRVGGDVHEIHREQTGLGETLIVVYELDVNGTRVPVQTIYADAADGLVSISFGSADDETAEDLADGVLDTLREAG